jgi:hypothetical protein
MAKHAGSSTRRRKRKRRFLQPSGETENPVRVYYDPSVVRPPEQHPADPAPDHAVPRPPP